MDGIRGVGAQQVMAAAGYRQAAKIEAPELGGTTGASAPREAAFADLKLRADGAGTRLRAALLQSGEAALAEVKDGLERMESLAREAAEADAPDREALQEELTQLQRELMRILGGTAALSAEDGRQGIGELPAWLLLGLADSPDPAQLLAALGLDESAGASEIMAAIKELPLEDPGAGYLAAVYLGAVIAGGGTDKLDPETAAQGLLRLLEAMEGGMAPDEAISDLTGGLFESIEDFQRQFMDGLAPGMESFFSGLLLGGGASLPDLMDLLSNGGGGEPDLLMTLLAALDAAAPALPEPGAGEPQAGAAPQAPEAQTTQTVDMGGTIAESRDPSRAGYDPAAKAVTIGGGQPAEPGGRTAETLELTGRDEVELKDARQVEVHTPEARLRTGGQAHINELRFGEKTALALSGTGLTRIGSVRGGHDSILRLREGAFILEHQDIDTPARVIVDGAVVLHAPRESHVFNAQGEELEPYDLTWKSMFPGWSSIEGMVIDGRRAQMMLMRGAQPDIARLWLIKGDPSQGYPAHLIALEGRGMAGELRTRYVYLQWSRMQRRFTQISMFPNPFTVTGGQEDRDWRYEEESRTLRVLTGLVTGLGGGTGEDAENRPFSGRLALADGIGRVELTLDGVTCRAAAGRACSLGSGNRVELLLKRGTESVFESGAGFAGISLGDGTSLSIDQTGSAAQPEGALTAVGGAASPGIGRDSGRGRERAASIMIRGGRVTAVEGRRNKGGARVADAAIAGLRARPLRLDALDISTKEAAREAVRQLSAGRRWVNRLQEAYRGVRPEHGQNRKALRSGGEAETIIGNMRREPVVAALKEEEDLDRLLEAMESMINP